MLLWGFELGTRIEGNRLFLHLAESLWYQRKWFIVLLSTGTAWSFGGKNARTDLLFSEHFSHPWPGVCLSRWKQLRWTHSSTVLPMKGTPLLPSLWALLTLAKVILKSEDVTCFEHLSPPQTASHTSVFRQIQGSHAPTPLTSCIYTLVLLFWKEQVFFRGRQGESADRTFLVRFILPFPKVERYLVLTGAWQTEMSQRLSGRDWMGIWHG